MAQATRARAPQLERLLAFAAPRRDDAALDVSHGPSPLTQALPGHVGRLTSCDLEAPRPLPVNDPRTPTVQFRRPVPRVPAHAHALPYPDRTFSLVIARFVLYRSDDTPRALRELLRVCRPDGRLVIADLIKPDLAGRDRDRIETLRDPGHPPTPSVSQFVDMVADVGADLRQLDVFTVERPVEPWLGAEAHTPLGRHIRDLLVDEVDGGPSTGARPRIIGGELWFTQTWAHAKLSARAYGPRSARAV